MNTPSYLPNRKLIWLLCTILIVVVLVSSCGRPESVTPVTEEPPTEIVTTAPTEEPTTEVTEEPTGEATEEPTAAPTEDPTRTKCDSVDGTYVCKGDREITLEGVPSGVTPYVLTIDPAFRDFLLGPDAAKSPETTCIFILAGDLAFYDDKDELVTSFNSPVTIKYSYLSELDDQTFKECQAEAAATASISTEEVKYIPVYYHENVWRPFKEAQVDPVSGLMTITFRSWGDQPIGGGSQP